MSGTPNLTDIALFVRIVEEGSISAAARSLGVPKTTLSRRLNELERALATPLLNRSTRALSLTSLGRQFFNRVAASIHEAESAHAEVRAQSGTPAGTLKISAPIAFGQSLIAPQLLAFAEVYPNVRVDVRLSDQRVNVVADGFDLAIRMGTIEDSDLIYRHLADVPMCLVASPAYLAACGTPSTAEDIVGHRCIVTRADLDCWILGGQSFRVDWRLSTSSMMITRDAAIRGLGVAMVSQFLIEDDLVAGDLVQVLPDLEPYRSTASLIYPKASTPSPALRALIEFLTTRTWGTVETAPSPRARGKTIDKAYA